MDEQIGRIRAAIAELGIAEDTLLVFSSDNGPQDATSSDAYGSTGGLRGDKADLYEGGIREPYMIKWPGVTRPGSTCRVPVVSTDFYPTILDAAGLKAMPEQHLDGVSLAPLLRGGDALDRDAIYWHYPHYSNQGGMPGGAIRMGRFAHVDAHIVVPEFWTIEQSHEQTDVFARRLLEGCACDGEIVFHTDPCGRRYCEVCDLPDCAVRKGPFRVRPQLTIAEATRPVETTVQASGNPDELEPSR